MTNANERTLPTKNRIPIPKFLPPMKLSVASTNAFLPLNEVVVNHKLQNVSLLEIRLLDPTVQLPKMRNACQPHPHNKVFIHDAASVVIGFGDDVRLVLLDLRIRLVTTFTCAKRNT